VADPDEHRGLNGADQAGARAVPAAPWRDDAVRRTRRAVRDALRGCTDLGPGAAVCVAVSGGADSLALAAATARVAPRLGLRPAAVVVDHGLQPGSAAVAARAADACTALGCAPVLVERVRVGRTGGPEAAARTARREALTRVADTLAAPVVLLGHTLDDQAETVLLGLARGSGARSLAGMAARDGRWLRPFLALRRATTAAACAALGLAVWSDPHNDDRSFARVRVRRDVLPVLEQALGPGVTEALARSAALLRDDADALDAVAARHDDLTVAALAALPAAVRRRVLRRAALAAGVPAGSLSARHLAAVDTLVTAWRGQGPVPLPGGLVAVRRCDRLSFR
jgi:tRNA(Ile)-lysidine synthetase-like protein